MEYAACVWDPYQKYLTDNIEKIQRWAGRWVLSDYSQQSSVTDMLYQLQWPSLQQCRYTSRLLQFHKIVHHHTTTAVYIYHLTFYLHHIQLDNYICIDISSHPFPPPATSKVSFLKQLSSEII